jgi:ATP synthase subunit 6
LLSFLVFFLFKNPQKNLYLVPTRFQYVLESFYLVVYNLVDANIGVSGRPFFSYIFTLFLLVVLSNTVGLVPYSFTVTSHLIVTFTLALMTFIGINIICIKEHGIHMLSLFLPSGSSIFLALLLIPIEIVSYFFRPISLSVRLFANMMAGHTLLKVIIGFAWVMMLAGGGLLIAHTIPLLILVVLMFLELGVACIQAYVFSILVCIYLNDAIHLH